MAQTPLTFEEKKKILCRECKTPAKDWSDFIIAPCHCEGEKKYVHQQCIKTMQCADCLFKYVPMQTYQDIVVDELIDFLIMYVPTIIAIILLRKITNPFESIFYLDGFLMNLLALNIDAVAYYAWVCGIFPALKSDFIIIVLVKFYKKKWQFAILILIQTGLLNFLARKFYLNTSIVFSCLYFGILMFGCYNVYMLFVSTRQSINRQFVESKTLFSDLSKGSALFSSEDEMAWKSILSTVEEDATKKST
ncbi:MAG: hypothetical protein Edafosvirus2_41 [Edafosvirus sp.]|uniref:E3 ubiquitin-protein ligase LAP n=1 Tax=Edafosvirus sp. TaxID=2487765 RepID=A0A3G4ZSH2_9VIRU|nr:MAG: hypothetical protein Edafosvirus2_41 [Edafosvirus sp.]